MLARMKALIRNFMRKRQRDAELDAEVRGYAEMLAEEKMREGMKPDEARRAARIELGGVEQVKQQIREARAGAWLDSLLQDVRYGVRMLRKSPGFAAAAILTLALGIGPNTAIVTVINSVLLHPLPYANPQELVTWRYNESQLDIDDIRSQSTFFSAGGGVNGDILTYTGGAEPLGIKAGLVDAGFFKVLGVSPMLGRTISQDDDRYGGPRVVVLAHGFWREYFEGDPAVIGKQITLDQNSYTIIGVMPATFAAPQRSFDLFVSLRVAYPEGAEERDVHFMHSFWRLKPGVTLAQAAAGMAAIDARLAASYPAEEKGRHTIPVSLQEYVTGDVRPALWLLSAAVSVVLLIACANFASLLMSRAAVRQREMVIRATLGGGRPRLIRQALTENILLAAIGGAVAFPLAALCVRLLVAAKPAALAHLNEISMEPRIVAFGIAVSLLTGAIFGLGPAWNVSRPDVTIALKEEGRTTTSGVSGNNFRKVLVVMEIALALVLLVGTGLLIKSFARLRSVDLGFDPGHVISINVQLTSKRYDEIPKQTQFRRELLDRLNSLPGVEAAMVGDVPLSGNQVTHSLIFDGRPPVPEGDEPSADTFCVMGDYFRVMRTPVRAGRNLTATDREDQPLVAVINEALARQFYANQNPVGQRIRWARDTGPPRWMTIVGVVADVKQYSLAEPAFPAVFTPFAQNNERWRRWMAVVVRAPGSSAGIISAVKREIWSLDSGIPLNRVQTMDELLGESLAERQFNMSLLGLFAGLAMILVVVGVYGVISYNVSQRTNEIGIRVAIGASPASILKMILGQGARMAAAGLAIGALGAFVATRLMTKVLFGVAPTDPATFVVVMLLMSVTVIAACLVPAVKAMRVDPMAALRHE